jgi:hypothetical protein
MSILFSSLTSKFRGHWQAESVTDSQIRLVSAILSSFQVVELYNYTLVATDGEAILHSYVERCQFRRQQPSWLHKKSRVSDRIRVFNRPQLWPNI